MRLRDIPTGAVGRDLTTCYQCDGEGWIDTFTQCFLCKGDGEIVLRIDIGTPEKENKPDENY